MNTLLVAVATVVALPGAAAALHLGGLAVASLFYREPPWAGDGRSVRVLVLVPAHNEETVLGPTLAALGRACRPGDQVLVVADRCTDTTAAIARRAGALVLERGASEEPGRAAARQAGLDHAEALEWDAIAMVDADSIVSPNFIDACAAAIASGAPAVQARSEAARGDRLLDHVALAASALQGVTMPRGRDRLGLMVRLRGTGMMLRRDVVEQFQFRAAASEDLWYSLDMCLEGVLSRHVESARLRSLNVSRWEDAGAQRVRYEAGRMSAAREFGGSLFRRHDAPSLEAAWFLLTPPFALAALLLLFGIAVSAWAGAVVVAAASTAFLVLLASALAVALVQSHAGSRTWLAIVAAPWYLPWKAVVQVRALLSLRRRQAEYGATPRV